MPNVATLPTDVASLQRLVLEQQHMIDTLKANLHLALHRQFGRRNESVDVDQIGLFAGSAEHGTIIELDVAPVEPASSRSTPEPSSEPDRAPRKQAVRILKDLPREIRIVDLPDAEKVCSGCGGALHHCGDETSEHLTYVPAAVKVLETRRKKYVCTTPACSGEVKRAASPRTEPLAKGMASASLLAFLIVSKFADGLPLYRIAARLQRLGIELAHGLMSDWLVQCAELLEPLHGRMLANVLASGHVFTDDTILPLQNDEPGRKTTVKARLWVYARSRRRHRPLVAYTFSRSRSQSAPLGVLKDFVGYVQCDAFPGYDALFDAQPSPLGPKIREVACWVHARRKYVEVTELMKQPGRAHEAIALIRSIYRIEKQLRPLDDVTRQAERQRRLLPLLATFKAWLDEQANAVLPKSAMGTAVSYTLKNWDALTRFTEQGYLEPDNNYAEQCLRPVAIGRKNFLFVGSERAGRAAAIYYSLVESCKVNQVNPLTYLTYVLSHVRDPRVTLLTPDEYAEQHPRDVTRIG